MKPLKVEGVYPMAFENEEDRAFPRRTEQVRPSLSATAGAGYSPICNSWPSVRALRKIARNTASAAPM